MNRIKISSLIIVLIVGLLFIKNEYSRLLLCNSSYGMPALIKMGEIDNLYIGSSMFRQGLDINELSSISDEDHYILAYNGNQPVTEYIELKYLVDNGVTIKNLYIDMYAYCVAANPEISDDKLFLETDIKTKKDLWKSLDDKNFVDWWNMYISSNNEQLVTWPVNNKLVNNNFKNGGTLLHTDGMDDETYRELSAPGDINDIQLDQLEALENIISLCNANNINLVFVDTPKSEAVYKDEGYQNVMNQYADYLDSVGISYIRQGEQYQFDSNNAAYYMDAVHLSSYGREEFTKILNSIS